MEKQTWYLELTEEKGSHKFYEITLENGNLTIWNGRIGNKGIMQEKLLENAEKAYEEVYKLLRELRENGFQEIPEATHNADFLAAKYPKKEIGEITQAFEPWRKKYRRPTWIPIVQDDDGEITDSKFSGTPYLLAGESIPVCGCCGKTLQLFLQLNLEQIPDALHGKFGEGLIQVFYCTNDDCEFVEGHEDDEIWQAFSKRHFLRLIKPKSHTKNEIQIPERYFPVKQIIGWNKQDDFPSSQEWEDYGIIHEYHFDDEFEARIACPEFGVSFSTEEDEIEEYIGEALDGDKLSGYPRWVQGIEYPKCPKCRTRMGLVFQIDSENNLPYMFSDGGIAHVTQCLIHKDVLALAWASH